MVNPSIRSPADLRGKKIGVQSIGGGVWMFSMLAFEHWGLNPERFPGILTVWRHW